MNYDNNAKALIMLSLTEGYGARRKRYDSVDRACELYDDYSVADAMIEKMENVGVKVVTILDDAYPQKLRDIYDPPFTLYYKGDVGLLNESDSVAVVGTRKVSAYGKNIMSNFVPVFVKAGLTVISGLARGVDSIGHRICLENGGKTVAVVANGIDQCYPPENSELQNKISEQGLLISEYPLGVKPLQYHFPERNRIISALSRGVFIPEAGDRSGSLITADCAIEQGRDLFVVPGSIFSAQSVGCNKKIRDLQATITLSPQDVLDEMGLSCSKPHKRALQLDFNQQSVMNALGGESVHISELMVRSGMNTAQLSSVLTQLEIIGLIRKRQGNYYEAVPEL